MGTGALPPCYLHALLASAARVHQEQPVSNGLLGVYGGNCHYMKEDKGVEVNYLYISKIFDSVSHIRLDHKLSAFDVIEPARKWLKQFLSNRSLTVTLGKYEAGVENAANEVA